MAVQIFTWRQMVDDEQEKVEYLIHPILPMGSKMLAHGASSAGKSMFAMTLALSILHGTPFLSKYPVKKGRVAYFSTDDMSLMEWKLRFRLLDDKHEPPFSDENFLFLLEDGNPDITNIAKDPDRVEWVRRLREFNPLLLVVDAVGMTHTLEKNDTSTPERVVAAWKKVARPSTTTVFMHHDRQQSENPNFIHDTKYCFSGGHGWLDACAASAYIGSNRRKGTMWVEFTKLRDVDPPLPTYPLTVNDERLVLLGDDKWRRAWKSLVKGQSPEVVALAIASASFKLDLAKKVVREIQEVMEMQEGIALDTEEE